MTSKTKVSSVMVKITRKKSTNSTKVKYYADDMVLERFYETLASGDTKKLVRVHIPRSEVFYAREAYYQYSGEWVSLDRMERCMYLEGMLSSSDVLDPHKKRDWEEDYDVRSDVKREDP